MTPIDHIEELQQVAEYRRARRIARAAGTAGIVFGALALFEGVPLVRAHPLNVLLILYVLLGALLMTEGVWNLV